MTREAGPRLTSVLFLYAAFVASVSAAFAQTPLTLEDAMKRAQGETLDARALASTIDEAEARVQGAQSGFWPRIDLTETVQRGNNPVFALAHYSPNAGLRPRILRSRRSTILTL